ncbi:Gfo/Idh/MocA family oxidoreductase [Pigmentiphaga soli]|uniref:Gfo/Idh/MocA family oxidoreductase n=1 Tax=Pigmentiphaga soli TaxID=1007095 RepID=A0ABP8HP30_9BURK
MTAAGTPPSASGFRWPRRHRVAVVGAGHWHACYDACYLPLLAELKQDIVGVSDPDAAIAQDRAGRFSSVAYTDYRRMLDDTRPDLVVALGRHVDMPRIFRDLVARGQPFVMEKPWGVDAATVAGLAAFARERSAWVCAPFWYRYSHWGETAREMLAAGELGRVSHIYFRLIRPTIQRYVEWDCPWMLSKAQAGGGALLNLGSHGFDMARFITGEEPEVVSAVTSNAIHQGEVEDYALVTLRTPSGILCHNEVGYTVPTWPRDYTDRERKVAGEKALVLSVDEGVKIVGPDGARTIATPPDYVGGYRRILAECLNRLDRGEPPPIDAGHCVRAVELIEAAYEVARRA